MRMIQSMVAFSRTFYKNPIASIAPRVVLRRRYWHISDLHTVNAVHI